MTYEIVCEPWGDVAEAEDRESAFRAAQALLEDNGYQGRAVIRRGERVLDVVWADRPGAWVHTDMREGR